MKGLKTTNNENWSGSDFSICSQVKGKKDNINCMFAGIHIYMDNSNGSKLLRCSCETTSKEMLTTKPLPKVENVSVSD